MAVIVPKATQTIYIQAADSITASDLPEPGNNWVTYNGESVAASDDSEVSTGRIGVWTTARPSFREFAPKVFTSTQYAYESASSDLIVTSTPIVDTTPPPFHPIIFESGLTRGATTRYADARYHTYNTWHLIPLTRPTIDNPDTEPIFDYFQTPYKDYIYSISADWSKSSSSFELPTRRSGSVEFKFADWFIGSSAYDYETMRQQIDTALHGKMLSITFEDDPMYNYFGVVRTEWEEEQTPKVTISYDCEPYRYYRYPQFDHDGVTVSYANFESDYMSPAIVSIMPKAAIDTLTINGLARNPITMETVPITVNNLTANGTIIIHGERKTVLDTQGNNRFADTEMWEFPSLAPGVNQITTNTSSVHIRITSRPRFI